MNRTISINCALLLLCLASLASAQDGHEAICRPSKEVTLAFTMHGQIADVMVAVGDHVEAGEPLVRLDDAVERAQIEQLQATAEDETYIEAEQARLAQSEVDLERLESISMGEGGARVATAYEIDQARLQVTIGELSVRLARLNHAQDVRAYEEALLQLDRMELTSPIEGTVEVLFVESGETVEALQQVIHLVNIDPLWIDIPVPIAEARQLAIDGPAAVTFGVDPDIQGQGRIIHIASVADAASETLRVRVELPNPDHLPAGQQVFVEFQEPPANEAVPASTDDDDETAQAQPRADEPDALAQAQAPTPGEGE